MKRLARLVILQYQHNKVGFIMITIQELPALLLQLSEDTAFIKRHLLETKRESSSTENQWFNVIEPCAYLPNKPAKATIYFDVSKNLIPYHKSTKKLRFLKSKVDAWLKEGKKKTASDIQAEADEFLSSRKRKEVNHG